MRVYFSDCEELIPNEERLIRLNIAIRELKNVMEKHCIEIYLDQVEGRKPELALTFQYGDEIISDYSIYYGDIEKASEQVLKRLRKEGKCQK